MLGLGNTERNLLDRRGVSRILIVDDDVELAILVRRMASIASREVQVDVVHTAADARENLASVQFDFILLDTFLGGDARGIDLVRRLRKAQPGATIAMISSMQLPQLIESTDKEQDISLLPNLFSPAFLRTFLHDALDLPGPCPAHTPAL